jgi:hypothetical protein
MFDRTHIYEVYENAGLPEEDRTELVCLGFSIWAFLFHIFWLAYQRLWLAFVVFAAIYGGVIAVAESVGLHPLAIGAIQLILQFWLGASAAELRTESLERRGYRLVDVSSAESAVRAERRYYDQQRLDAALPRAHGA